MSSSGSSGSNGSSSTDISPMKFFPSLLVSLLILVGCTNGVHVTELTDWRFQYQGQWLGATVPGCIHTDLMEHDIIPDPFYGTNEDSVQWVGDSSWTYRTTISTMMLEGYNHCDLVLDGITLCDVFVEGIERGSPFRYRILHGENMFREYRVDLVSSLISGGISENDSVAAEKHNIFDLGDSLTLSITFHSIQQINKSTNLSKSSNLQISKSSNLMLPDARALSRTAPYMQGWDWGPILSTVGITRSARLECYSGDLPEKEINIPESWNVELRQETDSIGQSFTFYKDGKPFFAKGANWIPCHSFPILTPELKERYRYLLTSVKEANFNMLRVWGGGIYEPDFFYDLCDSLGIMVWQDFNFSCALYPSDPAFLDNVREEALQQVRRIAQHPCVVVWCGNNEVKNGWEDWGWQAQYKWTPEQIAELQHGIDTLFGTNGILAQAVQQCDPLHRAYITSSPLYGWGHPECVTHGDSHYWGVWWGEEPFEKYKEKTGRFMSEFGFQSYPEYSTVRRYCPELQRNIDSPVMRAHQKHGRGREIIDKAMMQYYGLDSRNLSLEDYCYVSQLLQAWGTGYGILQHLLAQPHCMGTLYWQLDDCWPVASWSSIDYYGNWKALHYRAQALFAPDADLAMWQEYYNTYPKDLDLEMPLYDLETTNKRHSLKVKLHAYTMLRDVFLETVPHVDGHFDINFFDVGKDGTIQATFVPRYPHADLSHVGVKLKCLNDYTR